jgi:hypothetical protein
MTSAGPYAPSAHALPAAGAQLALGRRFTLDGDDALERHLERACARIVSGVRGLIPAQKLQAVVLGGGYGRGEGGVLRGGAGDRPYNDLELYVAIRGNRHVNEFLYRRRLEVLGEILTHLADAEVELKVTSLAELAARPVSMFSYDLAAGHRLLWSRDPASRPVWTEPHRDPENIPEAEATRLLMNRCTGLLLARAELEREPFTEGAADFVRRNVAKAQLACGDALLTAHGRYHWSCRERHRRLGELARDRRSPWVDAALRHHAAGVEFKLHPEAGALPRDQLAARHREVTAFAGKCWLWLEARRLGRTFPSARAYAEDACDKCPGTPRLLNVLLNLRADGLRMRAKPRPWRHPRQRIFHALALLLWEPTASAEPDLQARIRAELGSRGGNSTDCMTAYRVLWGQIR